jgi:FkbM family methyltransferase
MRHVHDIDRVTNEQVLAGCYDLPFEFSRPRILDIGANAGAFAIWAAKRWPGCHVTCYEPARLTFDLLLENTWGVEATIDYDRVAVVGSRPEEFGLLYDSIREASTERSLVSHACTKSTGEMVQLLDAYELPPCDIFKLDVEGVEAEVLERYRHFDQVKAAMVEVHGVGSDNFVRNFMGRQRFRLVGIGNGSETLWLR